MITNNLWSKRTQRADLKNKGGYISLVLNSRLGLAMQVLQDQVQESLGVRLIEIFKEDDG